MLDSIWKDIKQEFSYGNMVTRIIIVNVAFFLLMVLTKLGFLIASGGDVSGFTKFYQAFCLSGDMWHNVTHPWVFFTHMFLHTEFFHILWNMLFLYWFGRIVGDFVGNQRVLPLYILGGLAGALAYILFSLLRPGAEISYALGASGAVNAIIIASAVISPDYIIRLLFLGDVKLKYIAAVVVLLSIIGISNLSNTGGNVAHLGGALFGWFFIHRLREGTDLAIPVNNLFKKITGVFNKVPSTINKKTRKGPRMAYKNPTKKRPVKGQAASDRNSVPQQEQIDAILDKIKKTGYESLNEEEKEFLFNASKK